MGRDLTKIPGTKLGKADIMININLASHGLVVFPVNEFDLDSSPK